MAITFKQTSQFTVQKGKSSGGEFLAEAVGPMSMSAGPQAHVVTRS